MNTQAQTDNASTSYEYLQKAAVVSGAAALSGCFNSANVSGRSNYLTQNEPDIQALPAPNKERAARFLLQAGFHTTKSDIDYVVKNGYEAWIDKQIKTPSQISAVNWLYSQGFDNNESRQSDYAFRFMVWQQFLGNTDILRKRMSFALSQILVVGVDGVQISHRAFAMGYYWDLLNKHAFGNYRELLEDITLSPAMGEYLSTHRNFIDRNASPDENFSRELLQLFSVGLVELNIDGSSKKGADGKEIELYNNDDIAQLAHAFTGWEFAWWDTGRSVYTDPFPVHRPMTFRPNSHSTAAVTIFGTHIPENTDGRVAIKMVLDAVFNHPNVGPFLAKQLIQRLVTSNPSPAYIERVARVFNDNGNGIRGDLKATLKAILLDREARNDESLKNEDFGKLREPIVCFFQWARMFDVKSKTGKWKLTHKDRSTYGFSQMPMNAPSVFNFFRPGYRPPNSELARRGLVCPEMQLMNESSIASYYNGIYQCIRFGVGHVFDSNQLEGYADYSEFEALANRSSDELVDELNLLLTANQLSKESLLTIKSAVGSIQLTSSDAALNRIKSATFLIMSSYDYLFQQ